MIEMDLIVENGTLVDVNTGELYEADVGVSGNKITAIGKLKNRDITDTPTIDAKGKFILPGLMDAHIHVESTMLTPTRFAEAVLPHGTTTVFADPHEITNVLGIKGVKLFLKEARNLPLKLFFEAPSCVPAAPGFETSGAFLSVKDVESLLSMDEVVALGEVMNVKGLLNRDYELLSKIESARALRKAIEGHAPGLMGLDLCRYASMGPESDHEAVTAEEAIERLRLGLKLEIREGTASKNLSEVLGGIIRRGVYLRNCLLCSDDVEAEDLLKGHMDLILAKAVDAGADPVEAVRMATINVAEHFRLGHVLGSVAPGKVADIAIVDDLRRFKIWKVIASGKLVADKGKLLTRIKVFRYPEYARKTMNVKALDDTTPKDLIIRTRREKGVTLVNVIKVKDGTLFTEAYKAELKVENHIVKANLEEDVLHLAVIERHRATGNIGKGFIKGFNLTSGALATSIGHDAHNITVVGVDPTYMLRAVKIITEIEGGLAVVGPSIKATLPLPVAGLISEEPAEKVAEKYRRVDEAAKYLGVKLTSPFYTLSFVSLTAIPKLRLTDKGLIDVVDAKFIKPIIKFTG